ncbi:MAG: O-methyltransferase [Flammeovirgaceae bacterium]
MFSIINQEIERYIEQNASPETALLSKISRETHLEVLMPNMLSGHVQGLVLSMISKMLRPRRILEIGTYTGYSAICLAQGLVPDGLLYTLDINEELEKRVLRYFEEAQMSSKIKLMIGDAQEIIPKINEIFDLVFIDADKKNYIHYFDMVLPKVRRGGFILADNVLWKGKIIDKETKDKDTTALREFNEKVSLDPRVRNVILPLRDGIMIIEKI